MAPKMAARLPKMVHDAGKDSPILHSQDGPKLVQNSPKIVQDGFKMASRSSKMVQDGFQIVLNVFYVQQIRHEGNCERDGP